MNLKEFSQRLCFMKLASPSLWTTKEAVTRWQQELAKGTLGAAEKARLRIPQAAEGMLDNRTIQKVRNRLFRPTTDLNAAQLARHRQMRGLQTQAIVPRHGKFIPQGLEESPVGPAGVLSGNLLMKPSPSKELATYGEQFGKHFQPASTHRAANTLDNATLHHELTEQAMSQGSSNLLRAKGHEEMGDRLTPRLQSQLSPVQEVLEGSPAEEIGRGLQPVTNAAPQHYEPKPFASHLGPAAIMAESQQAYRDPAALRVQARMRSTTPDEQAMAAKVKQYGGTPSAPLPLGGKAHRKLDEAAVNFPLVPQAAQTRGMLPTAPVSPAMAANAQKGIDDAKGMYALMGMDPSALDEAQSHVDKLKGRVGQRNRPENEREQLMALLSAPRRDAMPKTAAPGFMYNHLPSVAAAMDAWNTSREQQEMISRMRDAQMFPALHATQPAMRAAAMGNVETPYMQFDLGSSPPVHHRRHRHHG
jgi:hypothetical protein